MEAAEVRKAFCKLALFEKLSNDAKGRVADAFLDVSDMIRYEEGEILIHAGYLSFDTGYILLQGVVAIESDSGESLEIAAPALLGEMSQFRSADLRSATVRATGDVVALQFFWQDLYEHTKKVMPTEEQVIFRDAIERQVWERFTYKNILSLGIFGDLNDELKLRVCLPFPSLSERIAIGGVDALFNRGNVCKSTGYILVKGEVKLIKERMEETIIKAPDVMGIFPGKSEKAAEWTATAMAQGEAEVLKFSWEEYVPELIRRLSNEDQAAFIGSIRKNARKSFVH